MFVRPLRRVLGPALSLTAIVAVTTTFGALVNEINLAAQDCTASGSSGQQVACAVEIIGAFGAGLALILEGVVIAAAAFAPAPTPRDLGGDSHLISVDGVSMDSSDISHDWWMHNLQNEGDRHRILVNTSRSDLRVSHEVWREGDFKKLTTHFEYEQTNLYERRTAQSDYYIHWASDYYAEKLSVDFAQQKLGQDIWNYMMQHDAVAICLLASAEWVGTGISYDEANFGLSDSESEFNGAPTECVSPRVSLVNPNFRSDTVDTMRLSPTFGMAKQVSAAAER